MAQPGHRLPCPSSSGLPRNSILGRHARAPRPRAGRAGPGRRRSLAAREGGPRELPAPL